MKSEVGMHGSAKKQTNKSSRGNQHICIVHPYACFLSTSLAVLMNEVKVSHNLTRKASVGMYYTYVLITPSTPVCLLFSTAIPTSLSLSKYTCIMLMLCYALL